jgi:pSer/pThr/pTyr-binding forkhead associated (FHA) protein
MRIFFKDGHKDGDVYKLSPPGISIGREIDNDIILPLAGASRYHSKLIWKDNEWFIKDLGSTNGTFLNGEKIDLDKEYKIKNGDIFRIGTQTMCFAEKESDVPDPLPVYNVENISEPEEIGHSDITFENLSPSKDSNKEIESINADVFNKDLTNGENLFNKKNDSDAENPDNKRKHVGLLFYITVIIVAIFFVVGYLIIDNIKVNKNTQQNSKKSHSSGVPFVLMYEKQISSTENKPNIFRFVMEIKDGKVTITRDDLRAGLRDQPSRKITDEQIKSLERKIKETGFMNLDKPQKGNAPENQDVRQTLTVAFGNEFNSISIFNISPPRAFDDAVTVLEDFSATELNVPAISLTPEERMEEGIQAFRRAKMLFDNYQAENSNLYKALNLFTIAVENLGAFSPEPPEYKEAYEMKMQAGRILREELAKHQRNANSFMRLKQYDDAVQQWRSILEKTQPGTKNHKIARKKIIQLEERIRSLGK